MKIADLDNAVHIAEGFLRVARHVQGDCAQERRDFPDHEYIDLKHAKGVVRVREYANLLNEALKPLRRQ